MSEVTSILYKLYYQFIRRSGLKKAIEQRTSHVNKTLGKKLIALCDWRKSEKRPFFLVAESEDKRVYRSLFSTEEKEEIQRVAQDAIRGKVSCFSYWKGDYGYPIDWHKNPVRNCSWPKQVHWTQVMHYEKSCGDIKLTWEINRFGHVYTLVRAYFLEEDGKWVRAFCDQIKSWEEANPYLYGVNWASGQELAIRTHAWVFALYTLGDDPSFTQEDFLRLQRLLFLHAEHIYRNINFAYYAVPNNHLIGEALGLYAIGSLFPWLTGSKKWKTKGRTLLEGVCLKQFYADGGYCQSSHNYHRLALHYYIWAIRIAECLREPFPEHICETVCKSGSYLTSFMNFENGKLPNWGANDGALLNPWTNCDYSDFRPLLTALRYLSVRKKALSEGPWDEELFWFFGKDALEADTDNFKVGSRSFPVSGIHVLRGSNNSLATIRGGSMRHRFGHADQLHVDIWWKGKNIAQDGGSFLYNDELNFHRYFMGTRSHNTVNVDGQNQMVLKGRFNWIFKTKAQLLKFDMGSIQDVSVEHYGYLRLNGRVIHKRRLIHLDRGIFIVIDNLFQKRSYEHTYKLHWLMIDAPYDVQLESDNKRKVVFQVPEKGSYATTFGSFGIEGATFEDNKFDIVKAKAGREPDGWISRYYGEKKMAVSLTLSARSSCGGGFYSCFFPVQEDIDTLVQDNYLNVRVASLEHRFALWEKS